MDAPFIVLMGLMRLAAELRFSATMVSVDELTSGFAASVMSTPATD